MRWTDRWLMVLTAAALAACSRAPVPGDAGGDAGNTIPLPALDGGQGRMAWRGMLPCADCAGIQTSLQLQRDGDQRSYQLVEVFVVGDAGVRFVDAGRWTREGNLIRTVSRDGSPRTWALLPGGAVQPRDASGAVFAQLGGAALLPTGPGGE